MKQYAFPWIKTMNPKEEQMKTITTVTSFTQGLIKRYTE